MTNIPDLWSFRSRPAIVTPDVAFDHGRISPSRPILFAAIASLLLVAAAAGVTQPAGAPALLLGVAALVIAALLSNGLQASCDLYWNDDGVEGPAAMLALPFAQQCSFIAWDSVVAAGTDALGNGFVADAQGNRISWNIAYAGAGQLRRRVTRSCPHLFVGGATRR